jgi:hypothetical protein
MMDTPTLKLSAVLSMDIPGLSASGDGESLVRLQAHARSAVEAAASTRSGRLVKAIGDSFTLTFDSCRDALACSFDIAAALKMQDAAPAQPSGARMGIHVGEIHFFGKDVLGEAVDAAIALQSAARPGKICISGQVLSIIGGLPEYGPSKISDRLRTLLPEGLEGYELDPDAGTASSGNVDLLGKIRKAILEETRNQGRRLSVDEAKRRFGWYGVEALEVIAVLAEEGILTRSRPASGPDTAQTSPTGDLGRSIESAIHTIVSEIERAVEQGSRESRNPDGSARDGSGFHVRLDSETFKESAKELKAVGREFRRELGKGIENGKTAAKASMKGQEAKGRKAAKGSRAKEPRPQGRSALDRYRADVAGKAAKARKGIAGGIMGFLLINAGLWFINMRSSGFPWAPFVSLFWGFGLVDTLFTSGRLSRQAREAGALPDLDDTRAKELQAIHKEENSISKHFFTTLSLSSGLALINLASNARDPWFIIPAAIFGVTFIIHLAGYLARIPRRRHQFFAGLGLRRGRRHLEEARKEREAVSTELGDYADLYRDAKESALDIEQSLSVSDPASAKEMKPQMESYLKQVLLLAKTANELDGIMSEIPMEALARDKAELLRKQASASESLRGEYESSISEIVRQEESFKALGEQREVIDLRLRSSVQQLQQLKIDLARVKAADTETGSAGSSPALSALRARSEELSRYIADLKEGNLEALADPFKELEEQYGTAAAGRDTPSAP